MKELYHHKSLKQQAGVVDGYTKSITRRQLFQYYYNFNVLECCRLLDISKPTLYKMLDKAKIKRKGKGTTKRLKLFISDVPIEDQIDDFHKDKYSDRGEK